MTRAVDLVLDSGAYSAWKKQETLDVYEYIKFILARPNLFHETVNLDTIPASFGKKPTHEEVEDSANKSFTNLLIMRDAGINAMPVYHQGEHRKWLDAILDAGFGYVGISPANDRTTKQKIEWLDEIFGYLCGSRGFPQVRTHGFGVTSLPILYRYPWYSADSVSWILFGAYGQILVPSRRDSSGAYDYSVSPFVVFVSDRSRVEARRPESVANDSESNIDSMGKRARAWVEEYLASEGFKIEDVRSTHYGRLRVNCRFYKRIGEYLYPKAFFDDTCPLFGGHKPSTRGSDKNLFGHLHMVFTTTGTDDDSELMTAEGIRDRLISWYHIRNDAGLDLDHYVEVGHIRRKVKRVRLKTTITERVRLEAVS